MEPNPYPYTFTAEVSVHDFGRMAYRCIYLPEDMVQDLPFDKHPKLRIDAEINDIPINAAWTPSKDGYYIILSKRFLRDAELSYGESVFVRFAVADQNEVDIPDALEAALYDNSELKEAWDRLTPGKQRGLAYRVKSAKRSETIEKRILEIYKTLGL